MYQQSPNQESSTTRAAANHAAETQTVRPAAAAGCGTCTHAPVQRMKFGSVQSHQFHRMPLWKKTGIGGMTMAGGYVGMAGGPLMALMGAMMGGGFGAGMHLAHRRSLGYDIPMETGLKEQDIHYGINFDTSFGEFGARDEAMKKHGGTVAEYAFNPRRYPRHRPTAFDSRISAFDPIFNQQFPVPAKDMAKYTMPGPGFLFNYPTAAGEPSKFMKAGPSFGYLQPDQQLEFGLRMGTRFSKASLPLGVIAGGSPRFHLDRMGSDEQLQDILAKRGPHADKVTSHELRYVHRYWGDQKSLAFQDDTGTPQDIRFRDHVKFYRDRKRVPPPWEYV